MSRLPAGGYRCTHAGSARGGRDFSRRVRRWAELADMLWQGALDLAYPRRCCHCGGAVAGPEGHLCWDCRVGMVFIGDPYCSRCGDPVDGVVHHRFVCSWCVLTQPGFDRARSAVRFGGCIRSALHLLKYRHGTHLRNELGQMLAGAYAACYGDVAIDAITCVPLHGLRERERSYNQSALLAQELAARVGRPYAPRLLARTRPTATQTLLSAHERKRNVRGAFAAVRPESIRNRRLLLVDDVMTTGATLDAASRALKAAGAAAVYALTLARG